MCDFWKLPKSWQCDNHRDQLSEPYGFDRRVADAVNPALGVLVGTFGLDAVKIHVIDELGITEGDVV